MEGPEQNIENHDLESSSAEELLSELDEAAAEIGAELEQTDYIKIGPTESMEAMGRIEMIFGALGVAAGLKIAFESMPSLVSNPAEVNHLLQAAQAAIAAGGSGLFLAGFAKLASGYQKFQGYVKIGELKDKEE